MTQDEAADALGVRHQSLSMWENGKVTPGDLLHADRHGAVRIAPAHLAGLAAAIDLVTRKEAPLLKAARSPGFGLEALYAAWGEAEDVH